MRHAQIEAWALRIIDTIRAGGRVEDDRVEVKLSWDPKPNRTARRVAGHANSAGGTDSMDHRHR